MIVSTENMLPKEKESRIEKRKKWILFRVRISYANDKSKNHKDIFSPKLYIEVDDKIILKKIKKWNI